MSFVLTVLKLAGKTAELYVYEKKTTMLMLFVLCYVMHEKVK